MSVVLLGISTPPPPPSSPVGVNERRKKEGISEWEVEGRMEAMTRGRNGCRRTQGREVKSWEDKGRRISRLGGAMGAIAPPKIL